VSFTGTDPLEDLTDDAILPFTPWPNTGVATERVQLYHGNEMLASTDEMISKVKSFMRHGVMRCAENFVYVGIAMRILGKVIHTFTSNFSRFSKHGLYNYIQMNSLASPLLVVVMTTGHQGVLFCQDAEGEYTSSRIHQSYEELASEFSRITAADRLRLISGLSAR